MYPGQPVKIVGNHPQAGKTGRFLGMAATEVGQRPQVRCEDGTLCYIHDPHQMEPVEGEPDKKSWY